MAYLDDLLRELEERNLTGKIYNAGKSSVTQTSSTQKKKNKDYTEEFLTILNEDAKKNGVKLELSDYGIISADTFKAPIEDIAPVKKKEEADDGLLDFFQAGALGDINLRKQFSDGYQFGDILKTGGHVAGQIGKAILGTAGDVGLGVVKGFASSAEGVADLASYGIAAGLDALGKDASAKQWREGAAENTVEEWTKGADEYLNRYSMAGRTTDAISQGIGQIGSIIATGGLGKAAGLGAKAVTALTTGTMGLSGMGAGMGEAYREGATDEEAATYGLIAGAADALTELLFGGLGKAVGAVGLSTGLSSADDLLAKKVSGLFTNQIAKNFAEYGIKAGAEGFEEVLAGTAQAIGKKITYMKEEELSEILKDENLLEQFVVGAAASGLMQSGMIPGTSEGSLREANAQGRDFITGLNQNEQTVIDKEVAKRVAAKETDGKTLTKKERSVIEKQVLEDLDSGGIDIDTIEEVLGGETYTNYKKLVDAEAKMQSEYDALGKKEKYTLADDARYKELGERLKYVREKGAKNELKTRLDEQVSSMVKDSRLSESFAERSRRGQAFEADLTQYTDEKQRTIVQKAVESGILNNTRKTRNFVDLVARIGAEKGVGFDFANNEKLKASGFALEGRIINGVKTQDGIIVNIQSAKALNTVVGHEITHVLEGTELYNELQTAAIEYAKTKGDYQGRYDALVKLYEKGTDIDAEITADIVGDYLFTDSDFINNLSANHRNVFQKIYDEVKYLLKVATAGSKEARELEKVKRAFEKAYREGGKASDSTKYKLAKGADGKVFVDVTEDIFDANNGESVARTIQRVIAERFNNMIEANGQKFQINKKTNDEFRRSNSANALRKNSPQAYNDKLRVVANADEILTAAKNWIGEEAGHSRKDDIVEFGRGNVAYRVGENGYVADVIVGIRKNGSAILYDLVNIYETEIAEAPVTMASNDNSQRRQDASADENVAQNGGEVKNQFSLSSDNEGRQLSAEQREYFKDSKIVDADGKLKVMYHGSNAQFTVFDKSKAKGSGLYGRGFYFTDSSSHAGTYGSQHEVYLDIRNPLQAGAATVTRSQVRSYLEAVAENEDYSIENYGTYDIDKVLDIVMGKSKSADAFKTIQDINATAVGDMVEAAELFNFVNGTSFDGIVVPTETIAFRPEQIKSVDNTKPTADPDIRFSLSADSEGRKLSAGQREYFKDSKVVDDSGHLKVMYHGTQDGGFHEFSGDYSDDAISFFFTDSNDVAASYSGSEETYAARTLHTADDLNALFAEVGATEYTATENDGTFYLLEDGEEVAESDSAEGLYEEFRDWTGLGSGSVNYQAYLNLVNPLIVDADGGDWHSLPSIDRAADKYEYIKIVEVLDKGVKVEYSMTGDPAPVVEVVDLYDKFDDNLADTLSNMAPGEVVEGAYANPATTRDYAAYAKEHGYDGVIFKNIYDIGGYGGGGATESTVAIAFSPEQIKSVANAHPTADPDIRRSVSQKGVEQRTFGNYNVYGKDIALEEDIAPVRQDIAPATVSKNATVQETAVYEEPEQEESVYAELDRLTEQAEELERQMYEAMDAGDNEKAMAINADLVDAAVRINELEQQLDADAQERMASLDDADAPIDSEAPYSESTDTMTLPKKMVQDIARDARKVLGFSAKQVSEMRTLVEKFSQGEIDSERLHDEIAQRFGTIIEKNRQEDIAEVRNWLRTTRLNVSDEIKSDFPEYGKNVVQANRGRILFAKDGMDVDMYYAELADKFPGFFPVDIINPADQLQRIIEVANMDINTEEQYEIDERMLDDVTDSIVRSVKEYTREQRLKMSEQNAFESFNSLMRDADRYAPVTEDDIAPVRADVAQAAPAKSVQESAPAADQPIKTVKERLTAKLHNLQTELRRNQQLREESNAEYEQEIAQLQTDYYERRNKNTKAANDILRRMERLRRLQGNEDARYAKRINDLSEQVAKVSEEARTGESTTEQGAMRRELHAKIVENIRDKFMERGYDLETVLKNAKDLSTFATVDNTPQRVMEKALGYKEGQILADLTVNQVAANETKGIQWLNSYTDRKSGLLAQISKQYSIKPGSKESAAAQMYAEGFYVNGKDEIVEYGDRELALDFPDAKVQANIKGLAGDPRIRQIYDATLAMINESRVRNAYPEIQKLDNYFLHFRAMDDTFSRLGIPFNPNDIKAKDLPTDLNGVTADLKPGQPYFASAMHRKGKRTSFDLLGGLERYLTSAKGQIYHIDDIQTLRALRNHIAETYGQAHGLDGLDAMTEEEAQEHIKEVYDAHLSTFAKFLNEEANVIAGKTALADRAVEGWIGRRGITFMETLNRQVGANMVGFNVSSSLTNFIAPVQAFAKTNKAAFVKGFAQTVANRVGAIAGKTDGFIENNPTMIRRQGADRFYRTPWQKASDLGYALMGAVDSISTEIIVRSKYNELVSKGMSAEQAVIEADKWTSRLMGDRSLGQQPQLYNSKVAGIVTKFQLEVRNQLDSQFYDTIQEAKVSAEDIQNKQARNAKVAAQVTSTFVQLAVVQHLFGKAFEAVAGYNPAFDIIEAIVKAFGWDDEEESEDTLLDNLGQGLRSLAEDMPYSSLILDGGRVPIASALPIGQAVKGEDKYGNEKHWTKTVAEAAPYWLLPGGYGQIKKTTQGLGMFDDDLPIAGSYTNSGNLRYPVEDTLANRVQAAVFGQYASSNARDYFDNERQALKKNQIQELVDVDIPIQDYWAYREGLNEQETLAEKFDYISGLDLPIDKKNILINNVVDRKEAVDLTDYDQYANYEEFDFAVKNPEKYDFLQSVGVSVAKYNSFDDDTKDAYNWAYQNPEKYTLSRAVSDDVAVYRQYTKALNDISADKDADGKSISGSRKTKVINYLNDLDADYYAKLILFKMEYNADDTYNREIIEYLNGRNDISFEEEVTILRELGFTVDADGTVRW